VNTLLHALDLVALFVLWWTAVTGLYAGHKVRRFRELALQTLLILLHAFAFVGALSLIAKPRDLDWVFRGTMYPVAGVAAWLYDYRFGIGRHVRLALSGIFRRRGSSSRA